MPYEGKYFDRIEKKARERAERRSGETVRVGVFERFMNNHVRLIAVICTVIVIVLCFVAIEALSRSDFFADGENESFEGTAMSLGFVNALSEKTSPIVWKDLDGYTYDTLSSSQIDDGTYVVRRYEVEGGVLSVLVGGYIDGLTVVEYANVYHADLHDFSFPLMGTGDLMDYLEKNGYKHVTDDNT